MGTLIVICGLSFSGKSTLAKAITARFGFDEIDVDAVGAALYGAGDTALDDADFDRIYDEADKEIERRLLSGSTVVDASRNFTRAERARARELAGRANARLVTIFVDTPEPVILRVFQPPAGDESPLVFGPNDDVDSWIRTTRRRYARDDGRVVS